MRIVELRKDRKVIIGYAGEHEAVQIKLDVTDLIEEYGEGTGAFWIKRPDGKVYEITNIEMDENVCMGILYYTDMAISGTCAIQLYWTTEDTLAKSDVYDAIILPGVVGTIDEDLCRPLWLTRDKAFEITEKMRRYKEATVASATAAAEANESAIETCQNILDEIESIVPVEVGTKENNSVGNPGQLSIDENYLYVCVADGQWKRIQLEAF